MLGTFPLGHALAGQRRLLVLKLNEKFTSQVPSCWVYASLHGLPNHPPLPEAVPVVADRLQEYANRSLQCPHCDIVWDRDVNACRFIIILYLGISG